MTLFCYSNPYSQSRFQRLLAIRQPQDPIVLHDDGVYAINQLPEALEGIYVLSSHLSERGLSLPDNSAIISIDMAEFVTMTLNANKQVNWN